MGLGHMRRNLLLAELFVQEPTRAEVLVLSGAPELRAFPLPPGVDGITLPALRKNGDGTYAPRNLSMSLWELLELRAETLENTLRYYDPDVLIVDKLPRGLLGELEPSLHYLRARGRTRMVLGLRDILDDPAAVRREWVSAGSDSAVRDFYDAVWVYGDPAICDPVREYGFSRAVAEKLQYCGYLDPGARTLREDRAGLPIPDLPPGPLALCLLGGGQDGGPLADAFARQAVPEGMNGVILTGPFMPQESRVRLRRQVFNNPRTRLLEFVNNPGSLLRRADRIIAMGGYNTLCEVLSLEKPVLVVPRVTPRTEQLIRAKRLSALGLVDYLHPDRVTPGAIRSWLASGAEPRSRARSCLDFGGLLRIRRLLDDLLTRPLSRPTPGRTRAA